MLTRLKRDGLARAVVGRWIMGSVAAALMLTGIGGLAAGFLAVSPALAQDRHDDRDRDRDRRHYYHPYYYAPPVYAPPPVVYAPPAPSPAIDFIFPIHIR
ncbi:MAG TPA: hypothetical protein VK690_03715 [Stellaceae bacterium]|jgi:hypothetical protein|nr:hypothetical protein [Stellaceae bacterium]